MQHAPHVVRRLRHATRAGLALAVCLLAFRPTIADSPKGEASARADRTVAGGHAQERRSARLITRRVGDEAADGNPPAGPVRAGGSWWGSLASLAAVVAMILLGARLWRKHGPLARAGLPAAAVDVLGRRVLDPRQSIYLVRLGSRILVLGSTPGGLETLSEITDPVEVDLIAGSCRPTADEQAQESKRSFTVLFGSRASAADSAAQTGGDPAGADFDGPASRSAAEQRRWPEGVHA